MPSTIQKGSEKKNQIVFILGHIWLMISVILPVDRPADSIVAIIFGLSCLIFANLKD